MGFMDTICVGGGILTALTPLSLWALTGWLPGLSEFRDILKSAMEINL